MDHTEVGNDLIMLRHEDNVWINTDSAVITSTAAIIPGELVLSFAVKMPHLKGRALQQALPFACEDQLSQAVDHYHFTANKHDGKKAMVAAMLKNDYQTLVEFIKNSGIMIKACYPDYLAVPYYENTITIAALHDKVLVRQDEYLGVSFAKEHMDAIIPSLLVMDKEYNLFLYGDDAFVASVNELLVGYHCTIETAITSSSIFAAKNLPRDFNLLVSRDVPKEKSSPSARAWILCAVLLLIALMIFVGVKTEIIHRYKVANVKITRAMQQVYNVAMPGQVMPDNVRDAINPVLQKASANVQDEFVSVLQKTGKLLRQYPLITVNSISYFNARVGFVMTAASTDTFNKFVAACADADLKVWEDKMSTKDKVVVLYLNIGDK
jgi:type II secretion system protein L